MKDRILRHGQVVASAAKGLSAVRIDSACDGCSSGGCWRIGSKGVDRPLLVAVNPPISGSIGEQVAISVSRRGLTRVSMLLFGPMLLVLGLLAIVSYQGVSDGWLTSLAVLLMLSALCCSQAVLKRRAVPLLALHAQVQS